jgi:hypothetical protein
MAMWVVAIGGSLRRAPASNDILLYFAHRVKM